MTDANIEALRDRAVADFGSAAIWILIEAASTEPHRRYHTLEHLDAMFRDFDRLQHQMTHRLAVRLAIWFHDVVYAVDERYGDNEARSAELLRAAIERHAPGLMSIAVHGVSQVGLAQELIRCTKGHALQPAVSEAGPDVAADARLFLDIDLGVLSRPSALEAFEDGIRKEFSGYSLNDYAAGRAAAMRGFLARPAIYLSPAFADREHLAQQNVARIVRYWSQLAGNG